MKQPEGCRVLCVCMFSPSGKQAAMKTAGCRSVPHKGIWAASSARSPSPPTRPTPPLLCWAIWLLQGGGNHPRGAGGDVSRLGDARCLSLSQMAPDYGKACLGREDLATSLFYQPPLEGSCVGLSVPTCAGWNVSFLTAGTSPGFLLLGP